MLSLTLIIDFRFNLRTFPIHVKVFVYILNKFLPVTIDFVTIDFDRFWRHRRQLRPILSPLTLIWSRYDHKYTKTEVLDPRTKFRFPPSSSFKNKLVCHVCKIFYLTEDGEGCVVNLFIRRSCARTPQLIISFHSRSMTGPELPLLPTFTF